MLQASDSPSNADSIFVSAAQKLANSLRMEEIV